MLKSAKILIAGASLALALSVPALAGEPKYGIGRAASPAEIQGWDIDVRPDGQGLPEGKGSVADGEKLFMEHCATCHGEFGEGVGRWPVLAGGKDTLRADMPEKTVGSYWPYASTVFDYIRHAMPFGNAQSLSVNEYYALTAYVLYLNDVIKDDSFVLSKSNFTSVKMPNEAGFFLDDRDAAEQHFRVKEPCMKDCIAPVKVTGRARMIDVTPEDLKAGKAPRVE